MAAESNRKWPNCRSCWSKKTPRYTNASNNRTCFRSITVFDGSRWSCRRSFHCQMSFAFGIRFLPMRTALIFSFASAARWLCKWKMLSAGPSDSAKYSNDTNSHRLLRTEILQSDFATNVKLLQHFPETDINIVLSKAATLWMHGNQNQIQSLYTCFELQIRVSREHILISEYFLQSYDVLVLVLTVERNCWPLNTVDAVWIHSYSRESIDSIILYFQRKNKRNQFLSVNWSFDLGQSLVTPCLILIATSTMRFIWFY